jgi:hypothetical protein
MPHGFHTGRFRSEKGIKKPSPHWSGRLVLIDNAAAHAASFTFSVSQDHH